MEPPRAIFTSDTSGTGPARSGVEHAPRDRRGAAGPALAGTRELRSETAALLAGTRFADVRWVAETDSTNADAMALATQGAPEGIVVVADHQRRGRGRRDRRWEATPGAALLVSVLLRPRTGIAGLATMAVGVAGVDAVRELTGVPVLLKWPNDLVVRVDDDLVVRVDGAVPPGSAAPADQAGPRDRKLAGILAEAAWPAGSAAADGWAPPRPGDRAVVVVGLGLNVRWDPAPPDALAETAVSLEQVCGHRVDREELLAAWLVQLEARYRSLAEGGSVELIDAWRARSATLGQRVRVDLGAGEVVGVAADVTDDGHLVVTTPDGGRRTLAVGDVVHLRAT